MGELIEFRRPDGKTAPGYLAAPQGSGPGIVVIQEWWGLNEQIKRTADRLAAVGYRALVPDLFRGELAKNSQEANHLMGHLDFPQAAQQDVRGALQHLKQGGGKAGVLGFCMGGALTIIAAAKVPETDAAVCFYGIPPAEAADPSTIRIPLLAHFATQDDWCNPTAVAGLENSLRAGGVPYELHRYYAHHAFFNEARPEVYDKAAAQLAWDRTVTFLRKHL